MIKITDILDLLNYIGINKEYCHIKEDHIFIDRDIEIKDLYTDNKIKLSKLNYESFISFINNQISISNTVLSINDKNFKLIGRVFLKEFFNKIFEITEKDAELILKYNKPLDHLCLNIFRNTNLKFRYDTNSNSIYVDINDIQSKYDSLNNEISKDDEDKLMSVINEKIEKTIDKFILIFHNIDFLNNNFYKYYFNIASEFDKYYKLYYLQIEGSLFNMSKRSKNGEERIKDPYKKIKHLKLLDLFIDEDIDTSRIYSNNPNEMNSLFGLDSAELVIIDGIQQTIESATEYTNIRHILLIVDRMCSRGELISINRHGMEKFGLTTLTKAGFEQSAKHLMMAGGFNSYDEIKDIMTSIFLGKLGRTGYTYQQKYKKLEENMLKNIENIDYDSVNILKSLDFINKLEMEDKNTNNIDLFNSTIDEVFNRFSEKSIQENPIIQNNYTKVIVDETYIETEYSTSEDILDDNIDDIDIDYGDYGIDDSL